jgi:hypothetical protein
MRGGYFMMAVDVFLKGNGSRFFVGYSPEDDSEFDRKARTRSRKKRNEGFQIFTYVKDVKVEIVK